MLTLFEGNFVRGFRAFTLPEGIKEEDARFYADRLPESRIVEVLSLDELIKLTGSPDEASGAVPDEGAGDTVKSDDGGDEESLGDDAVSGPTGSVAGAGDSDAAP